MSKAIDIMDVTSNETEIALGVKKEEMFLLADILNLYEDEEDLETAVTYTNFSTDRKIYLSVCSRPEVESLEYENTPELETIDISDRARVIFAEMDVTAITSSPRFKIHTNPDIKPTGIFFVTDDEELIEAGYVVYKVAVNDDAITFIAYDKFHNVKPETLSLYNVIMKSDFKWRKKVCVVTAGDSIEHVITTALLLSNIRDDSTERVDVKHIDSWLIDNENDLSKKIIVVISSDKQKIEQQLSTYSIGKVLYIDSLVSLSDMLDSMIAEMRISLTKPKAISVLTELFKNNKAYYLKILERKLTKLEAQNSDVNGFVLELIHRGNGWMFSIEDILKEEIMEERIRTELIDSIIATGVDTNGYRLIYTAVLKEEIVERLMEVGDSAVKYFIVNPYTWDGIDMTEGTIVEPKCTETADGPIE